MDRFAVADGENAYVAQAELAGVSDAGYNDDLRSRLAGDLLHAHAAERHVRNIAAIAQVEAPDRDLIAAAVGAV